MALSAEERREMGQLARQRMLDRFQIEQVGRRHLDLYRRLMGTQRPLRRCMPPAPPPSVRQS